MPEMLTVWVERNKVTDRQTDNRHTTDRRTDGM